MDRFSVSSCVRVTNYNASEKSLGFLAHRVHAQSHWVKSHQTLTPYATKHIVHVVFSRHPVEANVQHLLPAYHAAVDK